MTIVDRTFAGPRSCPCAVCGKEIGEYETRQFGPTGAVHYWKPGTIAEFSDCFNESNRHLYPDHYTDG